MSCFQKLCICKILRFTFPIEVTSLVFVCNALVSIENILLCTEANHLCSHLKGWQNFLLCIRMSHLLLPCCGLNRDITQKPWLLF